MKRTILLDWGGLDGSCSTACQRAGCCATTGFTTGCRGRIPITYSHFRYAECRRHGVHAFLPDLVSTRQEIKLRIFSAFRNHNIQFNQNDPVLVIATPDQQDIADIRIGKAGFGKMYAKFVLSRDLHQTILAKKYDYRVEVPVGYVTEQ